MWSIVRNVRASRPLHRSPRSAVRDWRAHFGNAALVGVEFRCPRRSSVTDPPIVLAEPGWLTVSAWSPGAPNSRGSARWRWPPWRNTRDRDDFAAYLDALLTGYRSVRAIDMTHLDDFIALRQFAFQIW